MRTARMFLALPVAAALLATLAPNPVGAAAPCGDCVLWDASTDGGAYGDDIAKFVALTPVPDNPERRIFNNPETLVVVGNSMKPSAVSGAAGDMDVVASAFDATTGQVRWKNRFDDNLSQDSVAGVEVDYNNNLAYAPINSNGAIAPVEYSMWDGARSPWTRIPNATALDSAIGPYGFYVGVAGTTAGKFLVAGYESGYGTIEYQDTPISGRANAIDGMTALDFMRSDDGSSAIMLATGQSSTFGSGGDVFTAAYDYRGRRRLWTSTWGSPDNRAEEGLAVETAYSSSLRKGVGFVTGRARTADGWDIFVTGYDLTTGQPLWGQDSPSRFFDGPAHRDDEPVAVAYSDKTSTVYVAGSADRGVPHGTDVVVLAYDAATGERKGVAYGRGSSDNGDDAATGLSISEDGSRVFVSAEIVDLFVDGGQQAGVLAFDGHLNPAGIRRFGSAGNVSDRSAGVAVAVHQQRVYLAGSSRSDVTGFDHRAIAYDIGGFEPVVTPRASTQLALDAPPSGQHSDTVEVAATLAADGAGLPNETVTLTLGGAKETATTDASGVARATFLLDGAPGAYEVTARFAGTDSHIESEASAPFTVDPEVSVVSVAPEPPSGQYTDAVTAVATLTDDDSTPIAGRDVTFTLGTQTASGTTDQKGVATATLRLTDSPGTYELVAAVAGNAFYTGDDALRAFTISREDSTTTLAVGGRNGKRVLNARLHDADTGTAGIAGRQIAFYAGSVLLGTATTGDDGLATFTPEGRYKSGSHVYRAVFTGDAWFLGSGGEARS